MLCSDGMGAGHGLQSALSTGALITSLVDASTSDFPSMSPPASTPRAAGDRCELTGDREGASAAEAAAGAEVQASASMTMTDGDDETRGPA